MSKLYDEALADANKIREMAVQDAQSRILEQITPVIRKAISAEISTGKTLLEQEELQFDETDELAAGAGAAVDPGLAGAPAADASAAPAPDAMAGEPAPAPVQPQNDIAGLQLPDEDGKIVVDFDQLFVQTDDNDPEALPSSVDASSLDVGAPVEEPALPSTDAPESEEVAPEGGVDTSLDALAGVEGEEEPGLGLPESRSYESYKKKLSEVSDKIDRAFFRKQTPRIVYDSLKNQLFSLMETLDYLHDSGKIDNKKQKNEENRLEFLNLKLKEAKSSNSYGEEKGKTTMATLKEFAAKLFEEENLAQDSESTGDTGVPTDDEATSHAQSVDGADDVDLMKEADSTNGDLEDAGDPFGDGSEASGADTASKDVHDKSKSLAAKTVAEGEEFEISEAELREVFRRLKKENVAKLKKALKEADEGGHALDLEWEEGGDKIGNTDKKKMAMDEQMDLGEYGDMGEGDLAIDIEHDEDSDMEGEDEFLLTVNGMDLDLSDLGDDEELEVVDGLGGEEGEELGLGGDDLGGDDLGGEMGDEGEEMLLDDELVESIRRKVVQALRLSESKNARRPAQKPQAKKPVSKPVAQPSAALKEAKAMKARAVKALQEKKALEAKLQEERLTTAKLTYASRLFAREDVSKTQKVKIAEFLDNAKSLAEAKDVYLKVEKVLNEKANKGQKMPGSTSVTTKSGAPKAALREGSNEPTIGSYERWQVLSGIKSKDNDND